MEKVKGFFLYLLLAGGLFAMISAPACGILYCLAPEHSGLIIGGYIGGTIGCALGNGIMGAIIS
ncbi:MAG TPA: hypothetical protein VIY48_13630 [Candidatus Paceibacterota bacterium]